jgi:hypothetical protein
LLGGASLNRSGLSAWSCRFSTLTRGLRTGKDCSSLRAWLDLICFVSCGLTLTSSCSGALITWSVALLCPEFYFWCCQQWKVALSSWNPGVLDINFVTRPWNLTVNVAASK